MSEGTQEIVVSKNESLGAMLLRQTDYFDYEIVKLLECKAIIRLRDKKEFTRVSEPVVAGDRVRLSPHKCAEKLRSYPPEEYRDYVYVPDKEGDSYLDGMRKTLDLRPQTIVLGFSKEPGDPKSIFGPLETNPRLNLRDFLDLKRPDIRHPIRDVIIVSHGNSEGQLELSLTGIGVGVLAYEDLEKAVEEGKIKIAAKVGQPRPTDEKKSELPFTVHLRGCQIGALPPFLEGKPGAAPPLMVIFKKALGDNLRLTAPRFFHRSQAYKRPAGRMEYMVYGFALFRKEPLPDLSAAIEAFSKGEFKFFDGKKVPVEKWRAWLKAENKRNVLKQPKKAGEVEKVTLKSVQVKGPVGEIMVPVPADLAYFKQLGLPEDMDPYDQRAVPREAAPSTDSERKQVVREALEKRDIFKQSHPYPWYGRMGYRTMDAFMADDQMNWEIDWIPDEKIVYFNAYRYQYTLRVPVVDSKDVLIANFYPDRTQNVKGTVAPVLLLKEDDEQLFSVIPGPRLPAGSQ